jgi:hypothetical protein
LNEIGEEGYKTIYLHRKVAEVAKKGFFLSVPRNSWDRQKELFWRIGLSPILQK